MEVMKEKIRRVLNMRRSKLGVKASELPQDTPEEIKYHQLITTLRDGALNMENYTREFAQVHGFSTEALEEALPIAARRMYDDLIRRIEDNSGFFRYAATDIANKYGFSTSSLKKVLKKSI